MMGLNLDECNPVFLSLAFYNCNLHFTSFQNLDLRKCIFSKSDLSNADFSSSNLSELDLDECNLKSSTFENSNISYADFTTAFNYSINPQINNIRGAKFSLQGLPGLLEQYNLEII
jgi:uncharacterized protein YjbI with pentapeptide repeats